MCGIFGYVSFNENKVDKKKFDQALKTIIHRGPDFQKSLFLKNETVALGHVRLSIIDLSEAANQPMSVGKYYIIFNGEIYNYIELKSELKIKGYSFNTSSDTEVLVQAYDCWGEDCVSKFNGMWAFAIYNTLDNTLFCSRDRFGVKPFNYYSDEEKFTFSSEIKPIITYDPKLRKPNYNSIGLFCREGICGEISETWFENIYRLQPGHNLRITQGKIEIYKYYSYPDKIKTDISFNDAKNQFYELFLDSVKKRMRSDVPVGTTLSGGLDSTSIVAALRTFYTGVHQTFTATFKDFVNDEYVIASNTNKFLNLKGTPASIDYNSDYFNILSNIIFHLESGHMSPSIIPIWEIYQLASRDVKVVLEGQGADELLGGYIEEASSMFLMEKIKSFQFKSFLTQGFNLARNYSCRNIIVSFLRQSLPIDIRTFVRKYLMGYEKVLSGPLQKFKSTTEVVCRSSSNFTEYLQYSHQTTLVNLLHYGDAISMAFSLESRLPFMDYRLVDLVMTLPAEFLINQGKGKYIQREALKSILPGNVYNSPVKLGFPSPSKDFLNQSRNSIKELLLDARAKSRGIFDSKKLEHLLNRNFNKFYHPDRFVFRIVCVELWFKQFIDGF